MTSLALDPTTWDLTVDTSGNIATVTGGTQLAQDAANAIRLFLGELYYDTTQGLPYFQQILGKMPPLATVKAQMVAAALSVVGVVTAVVFITGLTNRKMSGQVQITDATGAVFVAIF
jgi:hypothetical protein